MKPKSDSASEPPCASMSSLMISGSNTIFATLSRMATRPCPCCCFWAGVGGLPAAESTQATDWKKKWKEESWASGSCRKRYGRS